MYPRNAASPEPIAIGPVVQISDGAVQTSGVTVRIKPVGVAEGNGAGTTAYTTGGVVLYTPTQSETNYTSFVLIASKAGCIPASQTVITSESTVSGRVYAQTIATTQIDAIADQVWDEAYSQHTTAGTVGYILGGVLIAANFNQRTVQVTGSNHVAADVHELQPAVIQSTHFDTDALDANAMAASAVAEIQAGLGTLDNQRYLLSILAGATSSAGTAGETYVITIGGSTYTVTYAGLDAVGNRGATAFAKT